MKKVALAFAVMAAFSGASVAAPIVTPSTLTFTGSNPIQAANWSPLNAAEAGTTFSFTVTGYNSVDLSISVSPGGTPVTAALYLGSGTSTLLGTAIPGLNYTYLTSSYLSGQVFTVLVDGPRTGTYLANGNVTVTRLVPAPAALSLIGVGLLGLGLVRLGRKA